MNITYKRKQLEFYKPNILYNIDIYSLQKNQINETSNIQKKENFYDFMIDMLNEYEKDINTGYDSDAKVEQLLNDYIFLVILAAASAFIDDAVKKCRKANVIDAEKSISYLDYFKIVVYSFIGYMYLRNSDFDNTYERAVRVSADEYLDVEVLRSRNNYLYNKNKKKFENMKQQIYIKHDFDYVNTNVKIEEKPVSYKIDKTGKKICVEKVLTNSEYKMQEYKKSKEFTEYFTFLKKIENNSMNDKKHNLDVNIVDAMKALDALYHTILQEEMSIIDRCNIFNEIEVGIKIEMIYKWLKALKKNANDKYDSYTIRNIAKLLGMTIKEPLLKYFFPSYEYPLNSDEKLINNLPPYCVAIWHDQKT